MQIFAVLAALLPWAGPISKKVVLLFVPIIYLDIFNCTDGLFSVLQSIVCFQLHSCKLQSKYVGLV